MRKKRNYKRDIEPDIKYENLKVARFINYLMEDGKKSVAQKIMYDALDQIAKKTQKDSLEVFEAAVENASPIYEVVSKRVGGANYQVPREVRADRKFFLACHWLIEGAKSVKGKPAAIRLADEIINVFNNEGYAIRKKQNVHKMAEANRAFAHFAR
ncbi:MAG TPA: 30S ribosomal protein S7 [Candidatus Paceibacterota bacterium]|nr:30S ribosomal protein S7 [Candidatus Paceibacterota bacterium]